MKSVMCYSRESFTALYSKVLAMFRLIRSGDFRPDLSAIDRVVQMADESEEAPLGEKQEVADVAEISDSDSSMASLESLHDDGWMSGEVSDKCISLFPAFPGVPESGLLVHSISSLVHVVNEDDVLLCGRPTSSHFRAYAKVVNRDHLASCRQPRPLDDTFELLKDSNEVLQYLMPLPATRVHEAPAPSGSRPEKTQKAALQSGLRVVSVDHEVVQPFSPIVTLDLTSPSGYAILWDILQSPGVAAIHLGLPCGTSSRAREVPIPRSLRATGVPQPPPLRSADFPLGLPGLADHHQRRVDSANKLYSLAVEIILWCDKHGIVVSLENPANSWLWAVLVVLAREHSEEAARALNKLHKVLFHACCHGSTRRKHTGWLSTPTVYDALQAECQNDHPHEPWGVQWKSGTWVFDTASEAHYPHLLAQRATECLLRYFASKNISITKPLRLHDESVAVQGKQTKKHRPLIPEYCHIVTIDNSMEPPEGAKLLPPHFHGGKAEEDVEMHSENLANVSKYGVFHSPQQFLAKAEGVQHPMDSAEHLEEVTKYALDFNFRYPGHVVRLERRKNLLQAKLLATRLAAEETALHDALPTSLAKVLEGKKLLLWKALLEKYNYDDMGVIPFMMEGVKLVGAHDNPPCYPAMIRPATLVAQDLETFAVWRRKAIVGRVPQADASHIAHLEETALEELKLGFVEGPFTSEAEVTAYLGRSDWCVIRRFVLVQGAELKLRPIDDCLEAQLNLAYTVTSYLKLQDVDYIAGLALKIAERTVSQAGGPGGEAWVGKCLDLSKAYKQMGVHPSHRHLAVIVYHDISGSPKYLVANSLMFGSCAAVYSFNRVSRSLWYLLNRMLVIPCGVFYDDFPMFSPASLASDADEAASCLLDMLGWKHAKTGSKAAPFDSKFQVLGCKLDLSEVQQGHVVLENKPGRVDRLVALLQQVREERNLTKHQGQVLHGLMRYACGFFSGKFLHQVCAEVMPLSGSSLRRSPSDVVSFCDYAIKMLRA
eukprot:s1635_g4.t1